MGLERFDGLTARELYIGNDWSIWTRLLCSQICLKIVVLLVVRCFSDTPSSFQDVVAKSELVSLC